MLSCKGQQLKAGRVLSLASGSCLILQYHGSLNEGGAPCVSAALPAQTVAAMIGDGKRVSIAKTGSITVSVDIVHRAFS